MKITTILKSFIFVFALVIIQDSQAQLLKKLKDKVGQAGEAGFGGGEKDWNGFALPTEKDGQKDIEDTKLDGTSFTKDKWGISGIYIAQKPIGMSSDLSRGIEKTVQKFAVQASADGLKINFKHTGTGEIHTPFNAIPDDYADLEPKMVEKGVFFCRKVAFETQYRIDAVFTDSIEYEGKAAKNGVSVRGSITMLEPGVFVMHPFVGPVNGVTTCAGGSKINGEEKDLKYYPFNILYMKGKNISKWTNEAIVKELLRLSDMKCAVALGANAANAKMPEKVTGFKDEPSNADLLKAAQKRAKEFGWVETITAVYPTAEWVNEYKLLGVNQLNTLVSRRMEINAIMKTPSGECAIEDIIIRQDNIFTTGSTDEKFAGKPVYASANGSLTPIDCSKTKK